STYYLRRYHIAPDRGLLTHIRTVASGPPGRTPWRCSVLWPRSPAPTRARRDPHRGSHTSPSLHAIIATRLMSGSWTCRRRLAAEGAVVGLGDIGGVRRQTDSALPGC